MRCALEHQLSRAPCDFRKNGWIKQFDECGLRTARCALRLTRISQYRDRHPHLQVHRTEGSGTDRNNRAAYAVIIIRGAEPRAPISSDNSVMQSCIFCKNYLLHCGCSWKNGWYANFVSVVDVIQNIWIITVLTSLLFNSVLECISHWSPSQSVLWHSFCAFECIIISIV